MITITGYKRGLNNEIITRTFESDDPSDVKPVKQYGRLCFCKSVFLN